MRIFVVSVIVFCFTNLNAQSPQSINYQAIARDHVSGNPLSNSSLDVLVKIKTNGPSGEVIFEELHQELLTNEYGLFGMQIGDGAAISGNFSFIPWANGTYWLSLSIDDGNGMEEISSTQLLSVPYALHSTTASTAIDDADRNPENEIQTITKSGNDVSLSLNGGTISVEDSDADPENEKLDALTLSGTELTITEAGADYSVDLSSLSDDADADPENEYVQSFDRAGNTITLTDAGNSFPIDLSDLAEDADADPENEKLDALTLSGTVLTITEAGTEYSIELNSLVDDADADPVNEIQTITKYGNDVSLSLNGGTISVEDSDADPENEKLDALTLSGTELIITEAGTNYSVDLNSLADDADADPDNEIQTITKSGNDVSLSLNGGTISVEDSDADPENEKLEALSLSGTELTITEAGTDYSVDLSFLSDDADADPENEIQTISKSGNDLSLSLGGGTISVEDSDADPENELQDLEDVLTMGNNANSQIKNLHNPTEGQDAATLNYVENLDHEGDVTGIAASTKVVALQGVDLSDEEPADGQVLMYDAGTSKWVPITFTGGGAGGMRHYAVDPSDFSGMQEENKVDKVSRVIFNNASEFVTVHRIDEGNKLIAPLHLNDGNILMEMRIFFKNAQLLNTITVELQRKELGSANIDVIANWNNLGLIFTAIQTATIVLPAEASLSERTVDNSIYSYRIVLTINDLSAVNDVDDAKTMLYGIRLKYQY